MDYTKQNEPDGKRTLSFFIALPLFLIFISSYYNFLLFHSLAEIFCILIAASVFIVAWNTRNYSWNGYLLFIGTGFLFVAIIDLFHMLAYRGMGVFLQ